MLPDALPTFTHYFRRPGRWLRRTRWMLAETLADLGLRGATPGGPAWRHDNPFLKKTGRTETRRFGLSLRLGLAALVLSGLLLTGLWLLGAYSQVLSQAIPFLPGGSFPALLFVVLSFVHTLLVVNARTALAVSLGDEARRGTLPDLLLTPLRRAEMLLAIGVGPARGALLVALAGLPIYLLLAQFGGLTGREIILLYALFALLSYTPPSYALPALSGAAPTPDNPLTAQAFLPLGKRRAPRTGTISAAWFWIFLSVMFFSQAFALLGGAWLAHLLAALHVFLPFGPFGRTLLFFSWPYYAVQVLGSSLDFFHAAIPPLMLVLPLAALHWTASALSSASALSAGSVEEMRRLPIFSRAQTVTRWTARAMGFCFLAVLWKAWVESGDTASLAGALSGGPGWDAAGLLLLLGGLSLPNVANRALAVPVRGKVRSLLLRPFGKTLHRALKRSLRPLTVASLVFLLACGLGGLSPFAPPVYSNAGRIFLVGVSAVVWAVGLRRVMPSRVTGLLVPRIILYGLPLVALSLPIPGLWPLAALSPASAWLSLFPDGPPLLARFPFWTLGHLPPFEVCVVGPILTGLLLAGVSSWASRPAIRQPVPVSVSRPLIVERNAALTTALLAQVTARTDNPLFTQELRARTRSGRWADWRYFAPVTFAAVAALTLAYPDLVAALTLATPFHFFGGGFFGLNAFGRNTFGGKPVMGMVWASVASMLLLLQCYVLGFRGQTVGETLISRDLQRGLWGFILLTPLTARQIFWGKVFGQTSGAAAAWAVCGTASLVLYALASPSVGLGPALAAWLTGQLFVVALYGLGVGLGAALATFPVFLKALRGVSTLLFVGAVGGGVFLSLNQFPDVPMTPRLLLGILYALAISIPAFLFAQWRIAALRKRDIVFGDGVE